MMTRPDRFDRPIFIVCPPRSGSSLLFETLSQSPEVWTIGGESHRVIESIPSLNPANSAFRSNRLGPDLATPMTVAELTHGFVNLLRDRNARRLMANAVGIRFLEKTPKNALRVGFFARAYPDARFVYLHREPRDTVSSMLDAWRSGRFVTYPQLPGWSGLPWSLLLTPGWQEWNGKPAHEVVARQWAAVTRQLIDDLEALPTDRLEVVAYADLIANPQAEIERLCAALDLAWDRKLAELPDSRHTLTAPAAEKWRANENELYEVLPIIQPAIDQAQSFYQRQRRLGLPSMARPRHSRAIDLADSAAVVTPGDAAAPALRNYAALPDAPVPAGAAITQAPTEQPFRSVFTSGMARLLADSGSTLAITTYQSGKVILLRLDDGRINTHFKSFPSPMGLAYGNGRLALATQRMVWDYQDQKGVAGALDPPGKHDGCFVPRSAHVTGDIRVHEIGWVKNELWIVNTRFSCLSTLDATHSFVPRWRPKFISKLEAADRCHLNGMSIIDNRLRFVTALATTDNAAGWRAHKADGGVLIDVASQELVASGLSMPHSPRWHAGRMWVLESGKGALSTIDLATGKSTVVCEMPGFTRGLAFHGNHAFVGLSQVRESVFGGLPLTERLTERNCGIWVVDIGSGQIAGFLRFEGMVQEIFDVQFLPGLRFPEFFEPDDERVANSFVLPDGAVSDLARTGAT